MSFLSEFLLPDWIVSPRTTYVTILNRSRPLKHRQTGASVRCGRVRGQPKCFRCAPNALVRRVYLFGHVSSKSSVNSVVHRHCSHWWCSVLLHVPSNSMLGLVSTCTRGSSALNGLRQYTSHGCTFTISTPSDEIPATQGGVDLASPTYAGHIFCTIRGVFVYGGYK